MAETPPVQDSGAPAPLPNFAQQVAQAQQASMNQPIGDPVPPPPATPPSTPTPEPEPAPPVAEADSPAADPAEQRVRDAQRRMHAATQEAAQARQEADGAKSEAEVLRAQNEELLRALSSLPSIPPFQVAQQPPQATQAPVPVPTPSQAPYAPPSQAPAPPGGDLRAQILQAYKSAPDDESAVATLAEQTIQHAVAQARREFQAELAQREQAARHAQAAQAHGASVQTNVTTYLQKAAPDVPSDTFWRYVAAEKQAPSLPPPPPDIKNENELIVWQTNQFVERIRKDLSGTRARQTTVHAEQAALRGPAAAVISAAPSNRAPSTPGGGQPMSMVDQLKAQQRRYLGQQP